MSHQFARIPSRMKFYRQWIVWRYEQREEGKKPTKVPYSVFGGKAAVDNPGTWASFDDVVSAYEAGGWDGIGFVLTKDDPFCFIDLDEAHGDPKIIETQNTIVANTQSYAELSPSGAGLHIICEASVEQGRKRNNIEVYSDLRYMTMTGNVWRDAPIVDDSTFVGALWHEMGGPAAIHHYGEDRPQSEDDQTVMARMFSATNGELAHNLFYGNWGGLYPSQSEADFALIDIITFYTENRAQAHRVFSYSELGKREKYVKRPHLVEHMINRGFDRKLPPLDIDGLLLQIDEAVAKANGAGASTPTPNTGSQATGQAASTGLAVMPPTVGSVNGVIPLPPGLVGDIARFVYAAAPRPVENIALVAGLGLIAGVCGRQFNVSGTGLNQYIMLLAPTGTGKEAINAGISKLVNAADQPTNGNAVNFIGPGEIRSGAALLKWLSKQSCFLSIMGEMGLRLKTMTGERAPTHEAEVKRIILDLYSKSNAGNTLHPTAYSDKEKTLQAIHSPAFTMIGESTPERFYEVLDEGMIYEGLLPRFTIIEYTGKRPEWNKSAAFVQPNPALVDRFASLVSHVMSLAQTGKVLNVEEAPDAHELFGKFNGFCDAMQNDEHANEIHRNIWSRALVKALKLAATVAVGIDFETPVITLPCAEWACRIIADECNALVARFAEGRVGVPTEGDDKQLTDMIAAIRSFMVNDAEYGTKYGLLPKYHEARVITEKAIATKVRTLGSYRNDRMGMTAAIKRTLKTLLDHDDIRELNGKDKERFASNARCFMVSNVDTFLQRR